jgi:hypothetical protein
MRLGLSGVSWLYRDYSLHIDEAPEAPGAPAAAQKPAGRIDLSWAASSTTTNLAGYDVYRSSGAAFTKLTATPQVATTYIDTATADGTTYTYKVRAVSSGSPVLESLDSTTVNATADATAPGQPTAISLANGGGAGGAYINAANASSLSLSINFPTGSLASDTVLVTLTNGASVTRTTSGSAGAGTVSITGIGVTGLGDGTVTITAISTDVAGNVSTTRTATFTKDTVAPGAPTAIYTDNNNTTPDQISGAAEGGAAITATRTSPAPPTSFSTTATGGGTYSLQVAATNGKPNAPIAVIYTITAQDAAGNTSAATTLNFSCTH